MKGHRLGCVLAAGLALLAGCETTGAARTGADALPGFSLPPDTRNDAEIVAAGRMALERDHGPFQPASGALGEALKTAGAEIAARQPEGGALPEIFLLSEAKGRLFGSLHDGAIYLSEESAKTVDSPDKALALLILAQEERAVSHERAAAKRKVVELGIALGVAAEGAGKLDMKTLNPAVRADMIARVLAVGAIDERTRSKAAARLISLGRSAGVLNELIKGAASDSPKPPGVSGSGKIEI